MVCSCQQRQSAKLENVISIEMNFWLAHKQHPAENCVVRTIHCHLHEISCSIERPQGFAHHTRIDIQKYAVMSSCAGMASRIRLAVCDLHDSDDVSTLQFITDKNKVSPNAGWACLTFRCDAKSLRQYNRPLVCSTCLTSGSQHLFRSMQLSPPFPFNLNDVHWKYVRSI